LCTRVTMPRRHTDREIRSDEEGDEILIGDGFARCAVQNSIYQTSDNVACVCSISNIGRKIIAEIC